VIALLGKCDTGPLSLAMQRAAANPRASGVLSSIGPRPAFRAIGIALKEHKEIVMIRKARVLELVAAAAVLNGAIVLPAAAAEPVGTDNSAANLQPADSSTSTAAASDSDDRRVTAQIREALLADKSISVLAQHVQIATNQDAVILRGAVRSNELDRIEALAGQYAGSRQIDNQLTVAKQ